MRERLPKPAYKALKKTIDEGTPLDRDIAEIVANAMKDWAIDKGANSLHPLVPAHDRNHG